MMEQKRIYMASPTMHGEEQQYIKEAFDTNWIAPLGPNVNLFEKELAAYTGSRSCAALSAGTAALHLAMKLLDIKEGDVVLCSSLTFSATVNPAAYEKAKLVFVDSEKETWNMSPAALEKALGKYPDARAVILVHLYGTPAKINEILDICNRHQIPLIEDAAESLGALYNDRQTGTFGLMGVYSFNGNKIITTSGGGMLVSEDESLISRARFLATQARETKRHYEHKVLGYNYRMSNILAGIGRGQLLHLDEHIAAKKNLYETYQKAFEGYPIQMNPYIEETSKPNFWLSCMTIEEGCKIRPLDIMEALEAENIECRPIWKPMHLQPVFASCDFITEGIKEERPVSEDLFERGLCLPSDIKNTEEDMQKIISIIKNLFA